MMPPSLLTAGVRSGRIGISVIGLGYVGLPLALAFARGGARVIGADIDLRKVGQLRRGRCPLPEEEVQRLFDQVRPTRCFRVTGDVGQAVRRSRVHIIAVPTPLDGQQRPDLAPVLGAARMVGEAMGRGSLVVVESAVYPGVTDGEVRRALEKTSGLQAGEGFGLAYCGERIDPGNRVHRLENTPRVLGGLDPRSAQATAAVYRAIIEAELIIVRDCQTAEMVKLVENTFRDVNIAFANEVAVLCERLGLDVLEVLDAASTKWSFVPHLPGAGVGGACIPVNPYYVMEAARRAGAPLRFIPLAREINEAMPHHIVGLVSAALAGMGRTVASSRISILGLAYKGNVADCRGSPGVLIGQELAQLGAVVTYFDPLATVCPVPLAASLEEAVKGAHCVVLATDHSDFQRLSAGTLARLAGGSPAVVDGRYVLSPAQAKLAGVPYFAPGRLPDSPLKAATLRQRGGGGG